MKPVISIIGCGWMGQPCAEHLLSTGYTVKGSTTSPDKLAQLNQQGIDAYLLDLDQGPIPSALFDCDILFVNFPPGRGASDILPRFESRIQKVITAAKKHEVSKIIFASTTGVYIGDPEKAIVDESNDPQPQRASAKAMHLGENMLSNYTSQLTILRFAGLVGPGRNTARFLAGKTDLPNSKNAVNLVHLEDCVTVVSQIVAQDIFGEIFNVVSDEHPSRQAYYSRQAQKAGLTPPTFSDQITSPNKIVSNAKLKDVLNYQFLYPDPNLFSNLGPSRS